MSTEEDYFGKLRAASAERDSLLCIGLDPEPRVIGGGVERAVEVCRRVVDSTSDIACAYKPNSAFWEQYGPSGWEALATVRRLVPPDVPVLLDCKRADVPNTMAPMRRLYSTPCTLTPQPYMHTTALTPSLCSPTIQLVASTSCVTPRILGELIFKICRPASSRCSWPSPTWRCAATRTAIWGWS